MDQKRIGKKNSTEVKMKKLAYFLIVLFMFMFFSCARKQQNVARIIEDGVEVVVNQQEPSKINREPSTFSLREDFRIDTEREDLAGLGIRGLDQMDVDKDGSIYLSTGDRVLKFDDSGRFIQTIGRAGQGPGEYRMSTSLRITDSGLVSFFAAENSKFLFFNPDGTLAKETKKTASMFTFIGFYLDNGHILLRERSENPEKGLRTFRYVLFDQKFEKIKDLQPSFWIEIPDSPTAKFSLLGYSMSCAISDGKIYVSSNVTDNLEIEVYDFQGDLLKKIRRKSERMAILNEYKERIIERWKKSPAWKELNLKEKHYFPDYFPPFKEFWLDEEERILVETYKERGVPQKVELLVFNQEGVFVGAKYLKEARLRRFANHHLYCVYRKESGFEELVAYWMKWE